MAMNYSEQPVPVIYERMTSRSFQNKPISKEKIKEILTAGTMAANSGNMQPWEFIVVDQPEMQKKVAENTYAGYYAKGANYQKYVEEAGLIIVACTNFKRTVSAYGEDGNLWALLDTAAAVQNMLLTATAMGLGSCWIGGINKEGIRKLLNIPEGITPISLVLIGYTDKKLTRREKLPIHLVTHNNSYNVPYFEE